jgi:hypothetical protein
MPVAVIGAISEANLKIGVRGCPSESRTKPLTIVIKHVLVSSGGIGSACQCLSIQSLRKTGESAYSSFGTAKSRKPRMVIPEWLESTHFYEY